MKLRTALGSLALLLAIATPATSMGQRGYDRPHGRIDYGGGPFRPSSLFGNGYRSRYRGLSGPYRFGGASVYFGPGGGYGYPAPAFGYGYGYPAPAFGYGYGYPLRLRYGAPSYRYGGFGY